MKTIILDLDGTLLTTDHKIDAQTKEYLIKVQELGHRVILCSGRSYSGMEQIAAELEFERFNGYVLSFNGGEAMNYRTKEILFTNNFTKHDVENIYELISEYAQNFITYSSGKIHSKTNNAHVERSAYIMQAEIDHNIIVESPKIVLTDEIPVITKSFPEVKSLVNDYNSTFNVFRSVPQLIEITPFGSDKGHGIKKLLELENINCEEIIAFGDGENDITMLEFADVGIAMGNAMESVKVVANQVTDTNDNQGIIKALKKILGA